MTRPTMTTRWGRDLDPDDPLPEYPRPRLVRAEWLSLNGRWDYAITSSATRPERWDGKIVVPFSPEAPLSGVQRRLKPWQWLWYRRRFTAPEHADDGRLLLHFGAVDQECSVTVDGHPVGEHRGGYLPFTLDITDATDTTGTGEHVLEVVVRDFTDRSHHARGKQKLQRGNIWYTAQSGIWQTVWLEPVPAAYVADLVLTPRLEDDALEVTVLAPSAAPGAVAEVSFAGEVRSVTPGVPTRLPATGVPRWTPDHPHLEPVEVTLGEDRVSSYAAIRSVGTGPGPDGRPRLLLNGEPLQQTGVLDQGYWPDGLLTAPADAAMVHDITTMKELGFNLLRKHAKLEPQRWYHHCDRLGMLVWQDMVNGGGRYRDTTTKRPATWPQWWPADLPQPIPDRVHTLFNRTDAAGRDQFRDDCAATVATLRSHPSVVLWTLFNEGWGQFDSGRLTRWLRRLDPDRPVLTASGWVDLGHGDLRGYHCYFSPVRLPRLRGRRVLVLSEYGGYTLRVNGHAWGRRRFGYRRTRSVEELAEALQELHDEHVAPAVADGLAATVYTQLTDVEDELNGLVTYDREMVKLSCDQARAIFHGDRP